MMSNDSHTENEVMFVSLVNDSFPENNASKMVVNNISFNSEGAYSLDGFSVSSETPVNKLDLFNLSWLLDLMNFVPCRDWGYPNHLYFQLANLFLFLSYLAPNGLYGILYLRCTLLIGCSFYCLWGWIVLCAFDAFLWNILFVVINFIHVLYLVYNLRPVKIPKELEQVYQKVFAPLKVSRQQFKKLISCMKGICSFKPREVYVTEKITGVENLSLVIWGRFVVSQNGKPLHIVTPHQFLDSPEWFGVLTDESFQVSVTAIEESRVLLWHRDKLKLSIMNDQFLQAVFDHILGKDVVKKLMQVSETMAATSNGFIANRGDGEDRPLLVVKRGEDGNGITALINRQLQVGDPNSWRLGRIEETDHETRV